MTPKLFYRYRDVNVRDSAQALGYKSMVEIPPDRFLNRNVEPNKPDVWDAREAVYNCCPFYIGDLIQLDFEDFHALRGDDAFLSYMSRIFLLRMMKREFPAQAAGFYGVPRLIDGKYNSHMKQLGKQVDYCNVVAYRKCDSDGSLHQMKTRVTKNLYYADEFDKPIVILISPFAYNVQNKRFYRMSSDGWADTIKTLVQTNIDQPFYGWYCWSNAMRLLQHSPERLADEWTEASLAGYLVKFLEYTKESVGAK